MASAPTSPAVDPRSTSMRKVFVMSLLLTKGTPLAPPLPPLQTPHLPAPTTSAPRSKSCKKGHEKDCPVKSKHSKAEVLWVAGVIQLLNPGVAIEVQDVIDALIHGDNCSLSDALVDKVVLEYDGAKWHGDVGRDVRKMEALQQHRLDLIVRLRVGECPYLPIDPKWPIPVVLVHIDSKDTIVQLRATVKAINEATAAAMNLTFDLEAIKAAVSRAARRTMRLTRAPPPLSRSSQPGTAKVPGPSSRCGASSRGC